MDNVTQMTTKQPANPDGELELNMLEGNPVPFQRATILTFAERVQLKDEMMEANEGLSIAIDFIINLHQRVLFLENAIDIMTNAAGSTPIA